MNKEVLRKRIMAGPGAKILQATAISTGEHVSTQAGLLMKDRYNWNPEKALRQSADSRITDYEQFEHNVLYANRRTEKSMKDMIKPKDENAIQIIPARMLRAKMRSLGPETQKGKEDPFEDAYTMTMATLVMGEIDFLQKEMNELYNQETHPVDRGISVTNYVFQQLGPSLQKIMGLSTKIQASMQKSGALAKAFPGNKAALNPLAQRSFLAHLIEETIQDKETGPAFAKLLSEDIPKMEVKVKEDIHRKRTEGVPYHPGLHSA